MVLKGGMMKVLMAVYMMVDAVDEDQEVPDEETKQRTMKINNEERADENGLKKGEQIERLKERSRKPGLCLRR